MPTEAARTHHDALFGDRVSTLAQTDPELIEHFDDFAFDDVQADAPLDPRTRTLVQLAALIALGAVAEFRLLAGGALRVGVTPVEIKEVVYQAVPYVGMGRVLDVLHATNELLSEQGVELPLPGQSTTTRETRAERGLAVQKHVVGDDAVEALYAHAPADTRHIQRYLSANCFGDHYTRTGLDVPTRELLTLSMLVALGGADPQVAGHVSANMRVGNDRATLVTVITQLLPYVGYPRVLNALRTLDDVAPAHDRTSADRSSR
ncbi:carboxymuconolactone decarboxylase family protein [Cellulosimicrobium sp. CUA-896]|uniref:carboxymuconolactone decarboxylase family protein n=1 Tax=Cellulosimicrobium sp. CUA-896 TaxID=1517881 RepID=UPI00096574D4|nr:carboxymuconolactone decarboxylase family protein [Cellulosimicrobium sp. CUA-896]OLT52281.1 carboxymuconolactone decarboxylase [Cellulosimicrobium sp. CUA-896]